MHSKITGSLDCFAHFDHLQPLDKYIWKIVGDKMDNRLLKDQLQDNKLVGGFKYVLCSPLPEVSWSNLTVRIFFPGVGSTT